jgi:hypothetical protein
MKWYSQSTQIASFSINHGQNLSAPSGFMQPYKIQIQAEFICQTVRATDADVVRKKHKMGSMIDFTSWISHTQSHHQEFKPPFLGPGEPKTKRPKGVYANSTNTTKSHKQSIEHVVITQGLSPSILCTPIDMLISLPILQFDRECNEKLFMFTETKWFTLCCWTSRGHKSQPPSHEDAGSLGNGMFLQLYPSHVETA